MNDKKYVLEIWCGTGSSYVPLDSVAELDTWRAANPGFDGDLYTHDGHLVNESKLRRAEQLAEPGKGDTP